MKEFKDRVAVVTGAAAGIGRAMAETFIQAGMKVVLADVDEKILAATEEELKTNGATVLAVPADVSKADQMKALAEKTINAFGGVHVLCNNAAVSCNRPNSYEIPLSGWQWVMGVNLMGVVHGIHFFLPIMLSQKSSGHIVNTACVSGLLNDFNNTPYCISKHAVIALSENLYLELEEKNANVGVSVLCPGPTNTNIHTSIHRVRPADVPPDPEPTEEEELFIKAYHTWLKRSPCAMQVAGKVFEAIKENRFYILPYDVRPNIEQRLHHIIHMKNPEPSPPPEEFMAIVREILGEEIGF